MFKKILFSIIVSFSLNSLAEEKFVPFNSIRFEASGGGSDLKYQNKNSTKIDTSSSKKIMNFNLKYVWINSPKTRWLVGVYIEDYSYKNINMVNEFSGSPTVGFSYSLTDSLNVGLEALGYQHLEMNPQQNLYRKMDPAIRLEWKYDALNFDKDSLGIGQYYQTTTPIKSMGNDPYSDNLQPDYDIVEQIYYRSVYEKNTLEFFVSHHYKVMENAYYKLETNNFLVGFRFALPIQ